MLDLLNGYAQSFPAELIPIAAIMMVFGIPIVAILTAHQRKMTKLIHGQNKPAMVDLNTQRQLELMQAQIGELRGMIQEHIINNDRASIVSQIPPAMPTIEQRLNS